MFGGLVVVVVLGVLVVTALVVLVIVLTRATPDVALLETTAAARRHAVVGGALAFGSGAVALLAMPVVLELGRPAPVGAPGLPLALAPACAATVYVLVLGLTELTWPRPVGNRRAARLTPRSIGGVTSRRWVQALVGAVLALVAMVLFAGLVAAEDGRSIATSSAAGGASAGPFPGWPYGLPALGAVAVLVAGAALVLRLVVARPAVEGADPRTDEALRQASAHRVLRGALAGTLVTLGALVAVGSLAVVNVYEGPLRAAGFAMALVGLAVVILGAVTTCLPAPSVPAPSAPTPVAAR